MTYRQWKAIWTPSSTDRGFPTFSERSGQEVTVVNKITNEDLYDIEFGDGATTRAFKRELVRDGTQQVAGGGSTSRPRKRAVAEPTAASK